MQQLNTRCAFSMLQDGDEIQRELEAIFDRIEAEELARRERERERERDIYIYIYIFIYLLTGTAELPAGGSEEPARRRVRRRGGMEPARRSMRVWVLRALLPGWVISGM